MKLLFATRNKHKLAEVRALFDFPGLELVCIADIAGLPDEVVEDQDSFKGNALKKARVLSRSCGLWTMADDSGLEVAALNNAPGVYSARYAGEHCSYEDNNAKLLRELEGIVSREACFRCALALCAPDGRCWCIEKTCHGVIAEEERGTNGFGYDPLFVPQGYGGPFAELDAATKNRVSHRGQAMRKAALEWRATLERAMRAC